MLQADTLQSKMVQNENFPLLLRALDVVGNPQTTQQEKREAQQYLNQVRASALGFVLQTAGQLCSQAKEHVHVFGYKMLAEVVRKRWHECSEDQKEEILNFASRSISKVGKSSGLSVMTMTAVARFTALVLARQSPEQLSSSWRSVLHFAREGCTQLEVVCHVACLLCGELNYSENRRDDGEHQALKRCLTAIGPESLRTFSKLIEANYGLGVKAEEAGDGGTADRHFKLIEAVLKVYDSWMNLVPLFKLKEAGVLQVCNGLSRRSRFEPGIIIVLEKIVRRENICDADALVGIEAGSITFQLLDAFHTKRRSKTLDLYADKNFERVFTIATAVCSFAANYIERTQSDSQKIVTLLAQALSIFKFGSMEIAVVSLPLWSRVLAYPRPPRLSTQTNIAIRKAVGTFSKDLSLCLFGLYEHMETTNGKEDHLQEYTSIEDFRGKHSIQLCVCLTNFTYLYPSQAEAYINEVTQTAIAICNDRMSNAARRMICMRKVAITLGPASKGKVGDSAAIKRLMLAVLGNLLKVDIGSDMELGYWFGKALKSCARAVKMDRELCAHLIPSVLDILWKLPKPTAGFGLPSVEDAKYKNYSEVRMTLCTIIRDVVEQTPKALLPVLVGFRKKVDDARRGQLITMAEYIVLLEVATIAAQQGSGDVRNEVMEWCLKPVYDSWKRDVTRFIYRSDNRFAEQYVAIEAQNPDGTLQMGGREHRWQLYHEILLLLKVFSRCTRPKRESIAGKDPSAANPVEKRLDLVLMVGWILRCIIGISERARTNEWLDRLLKMGVEDAEAFAYGDGGHAKRNELEEAVRVAGTEMQSCRMWLQAIFDRCGQILGNTGNTCPSFWSNKKLSGKLPKMVTEKAGLLNARYSSILLERVLIPWMKYCPSWNRTTWIVPVISEVLPKIHEDIMEGWETLSSIQTNGLGVEGDLQEIAYQGLLQEQSEHFAVCLEAISAGHVEELSKRKSKPVIDDLMEKDKARCHVLMGYAVDLLRLKNWSIVENLVKFCRYCVRMSSKIAELATITQMEILPIALEMLFDSAMESVAGCLVGLITDILTRFLGESYSVQDLLKQVPGVTQADCDQLVRQYMKASAPQQRSLTTEFFVHVCGEEMLALSEFRKRKKT